MNPWLVGIAYLVALALALAFNHGAHRKPSPKPTETRASGVTSTTDAAS